MNDNKLIIIILLSNAAYAYNNDVGLGTLLV